MEFNESILMQISEHLDISPSDYKRAKDRFNAVKNWLIGREYYTGSQPDVYLQGSFRLGTVVRPFRNDKDAEFDIDQVCELTNTKYEITPGDLKQDIGDRLKENQDYKRMLDEEGKRCWTLIYASDDGRPGFHLDVLPACLLNNNIKFQIDITNKDSNNYSWSISNPKGYYYWFKSKNVFDERLMNEQGNKIYQSNRGLYRDVSDVPKQLFRTSLQRAIQIMKRHRDVHFSEKNSKPISIIITTITTQIYNKSNILETVYEFIRYVLNRYEFLVKNGYLEKDGILDYSDGYWSIPNPVDNIYQYGEIENFADKWNEDETYPNSFFEWVLKLKRDIEFYKKSGSSDDLNLRVIDFGNKNSYSNILKNELKKLMEEKRSANGYSYSPVLDSINLAIDGKMDWDFVNSVAQYEFDIASDEDSKNVAKINYYQVALHSGKELSDSAVNDIKSILHQEKSSSFILCTNILLGTATFNMIRQFALDKGNTGFLEWPILRLFNYKNMEY